VTGPVVDVGVVTWNTRDVTVPALRSLIDEQDDCTIRLLVHDNGSTDGTVEAIARAVPEAEVEAGGVNLGFGAGMNHLIARGRAPWFFALNSDAWPRPGALRRLVEEAERQPRAAAVAPRLERPDGSLEFSTHPFPSIRIAALTAVGADRWMSHERAVELLLEGYWAHDVARPVDWAIGAALLMRRSALDQIGGFDPRFFMYAEDVEWCWRAAQAGWQIHFEPEAVVCHVGNASGAVAYGRRRTIAYLRNTHRFYRGAHGPVSALAYRLLCLAGSARLYVAARARRDRSAASFWADHVRAHLRPIGGPDGPPTDAPAQR
jgi:GT2 family glycosyltransferase